MRSLQHFTELLEQESNLANLTKLTVIKDGKKTIHKASDVKPLKDKKSDKPSESQEPIKDDDKETETKKED